MKKFQFNFEKLQVWQKARNLSKTLYFQTESFPPEERYRLADQICCQLQLATDVNLIAENVFQSIRTEIREISLMLNALKTSLTNRQKTLGEAD